MGFLHWQGSSSRHARLGHRLYGTPSSVAPILPSPVEAFEPGELLRSASGLLEGCFELRGDKIRDEMLTPLMQIVEPVDLTFLAVVYAITCKNGIADRFFGGRRKQERCGDLKSMLADRSECEARNLRSLPLALFRPLRLLCCRIFPMFYLTDVVAKLCRNFGMVVPAAASTAVSTVGYGIFAANLIASLKRFGIARVLSRHQGSLWRNRLETIDRVGDALVWTIVAIVCLELLSVQCGFALTSLLTFGGVGSLVLGLAFQEPLSNVVAGVLLALSNPFDVGDEVDLGDGVTGYVVDLGWYRTLVRGYDNRVITVPNAQITGATTTNYSRMEYKLFATKLVLRQRDFQKCENLIPALREELSRLPAVVDVPEDNLSLRVFLAGLGAGGTPEIEIEVHLIGNNDDAFFLWKQQALVTIRRVLDRHECELSIRAAVSLKSGLQDYENAEAFGRPKVVNEHMLAVRPKDPLAPATVYAGELLPYDDDDDDDSNHSINNEHRLEHPKTSPIPAVPSFSY